MVLLDGSPNKQVNFWFDKEANQTDFPFHIVYLQFDEAIYLDMFPNIKWVVDIV